MVQVIPGLKIFLLFVAVFALKMKMSLAFGDECPQKGHFIYGSLSIFGPVVFFLCFVLVFSRPFWEFVVDCCCLRYNLKRLLASPSSAVKIYLVTLAPFLLLACAFSWERHYSCTMYGRNQRNEVSREAIENAEDRRDVLIWEILMSWLVISPIVVSLYRVLSTELKRQNSAMNSTQFILVIVIKNMQFNGEVKAWRALVLLSFFSLSVSGPICDRFPQKLEFKPHVNLRTTFSG